MRIIGIDPGLRHTGFGVVDVVGNRHMHYVCSGSISTTDKSDANRPLAQRLAIIYDGIGQIIRQYQPDTAAVEIVFVNVNPKSTLLLGQARGVALCALACNALDVAEYTALQMKQAVTGYGKAHKEQVQHMVQSLLRLNALPRADAADALGIAITHGHHLLHTLRLPDPKAQK